MKHTPSVLTSTLRPFIGPLFCIFLVSIYSVLSEAQPVNTPNPEAESAKTMEKESGEEKISAKKEKVTLADKNIADKNITVTDKNRFEREKEARLEELRYKHLWIAYSLVWLIIFMFMRSTKQKSQAVSERLDELKNRLNKLEETQRDSK